MMVGRMMMRRRRRMRMRWRRMMMTLIKPVNFRMIRLLVSVKMMMAMIWVIRLMLAITTWEMTIRKWLIAMMAAIMVTRC